MMGLEGVLVVDKPAGMTSADVVARVKRALGGIKAGHTGTLDPMATGVLPVCLGEATKLAGVLASDDKAYDGELELGAETDTLDATGTIVRERREAVATIDPAAIEREMAAMVGEQLQVPPMYSAIKQGGRRLYELARAGTEVVRSPRSIRIDSFRSGRFVSPRLCFSVTCSKGTYVRTLVADLGERLGCGAHLTALRRTRSGSFVIEQAVPLAEIDADRAAAVMIGPAEATRHLPSASLSGDATRAATQGKLLIWNEISSDPAPTGPARLLAADGQLVALVRVSAGRIAYDRVLRIGLT